MAKVPRVVQCWWPLRKGPREFVQSGKERGELLIAMSFLDGIQFDQLPAPIRLFSANMYCKVVEAQSLVLERVDIHCTVGMATRPSERSSVVYKSLMPVFNENFPVQCLDPFVDQLRVAFFAKGKKLLGHALIPASIVAARAAMGDGGHSTLDFWFPLLDRHAGNQLENSKSCGKVHVVLYFGCNPSPHVLMSEPMTLVACVERLSTKNSFVKRWMLLRGPTHLPPTIYNFHEKSDADACLIGRSTSATVVAGANLAPEAVTLPRSVSTPAGRTLVFRAHDGSRHVLVFVDVLSRDLWHSTLAQFAQVVGNWYEPTLTGVTPTLCDLQPRVRAVAAGSAPAQSGTVTSDSGSLLSGTMDYFISRGVGVKPDDEDDDDDDNGDGGGGGDGDDDNDNLERRRSGPLADDYVDESVRHVLEASPSYPDVKYVDINPLLALKAMSDEEAAFRDMELHEPKKQAPKAAKSAPTTPAADDPFAFSPMPPPTPSPSNSPPPSPRASDYSAPPIIIPSVRELTSQSPALPAKKANSTPPLAHVDEDVTPMLPPKKARSAKPAVAGATAAAPAATTAAATTAAAAAAAPAPASLLAVPKPTGANGKVSPNISPRASPSLSPRPAPKATVAATAAGALAKRGSDGPTVSAGAAAAAAAAPQALAKRGSDGPTVAAAPRAASAVQHQSLRARATVAKPAAAEAAAVPKSHMYAGMPALPQDLSDDEDSDAQPPPPPRESAIQSYDRVPVEEELPVPPADLDGYGHMPAEKIVGGRDRQYALLPLSPPTSVELDEESLPPWGGAGLVAEESKS